MTAEEIQVMWIYTRGLEGALRAYYNQHQATSCKCELCKNTVLAFAWSPERMKAEKAGSLKNDPF